MIKLLVAMEFIALKTFYLMKVWNWFGYIIYDYTISYLEVFLLVFLFNVMRLNLAIKQEEHEITWEWLLLVPSFFISLLIITYIIKALTL